MGEIIAAVHHGLLAIAREHKVDLKAILAQYAIERLIARLSKSAESPRFVLRAPLLKGGRSGAFPACPCRKLCRKFVASSGCGFWPHQVRLAIGCPLCQEQPLVEQTLQVPLQRSPVHAFAQELELLNGQGTMFQDMAQRHRLPLRKFVCLHQNVAMDRTLPSLLDLRQLRCETLVERRREERPFPSTNGWI
jgi:hypothetical protein